MTARSFINAGRRADARPPDRPAARRSRWLVLAAACALAACANPFAGRPMDMPTRTGVAAGTVSVTYENQAPGRPRPARTEGSTAGAARTGRLDTESARRAWLDALSGHLSERAAAALPTGQTLQVHLADVQRAGGTAPGRSLQSSELDAARDADAPRIDLRFERRAADGKVLQSASRQLREAGWSALRGRDADDPLAREKRLVDDWVAREFGPLR